MRMSISLITLWYNFTYCVSQGTDLPKSGFSGFGRTQLIP